LGRTQPAISQQIKKLEQQLGQRLLSREGGRAQLTPAGDELLAYARQILSLNDSAIAHFEAPAVSGRLRFGIPSEFAVSLLPKIINRFAKAYPDVLLEVFSDLSRNLVAQAQRSDYDLILALQDRPEPASADHITTDQLVWVSGPRSQRLSQETIALIAAPEGCIYRQRALRCLSNANKRWRIVYTNPDLTGIQAAIEADMGVTVLARSAVPDHLVVIENSKWLPPLGAIGISLKRTSAAPSQAEQLLAQFVKAGLLRAIEY
jgi:DNA-binding transcriptional LysR family regulator